MCAATTGTQEPTSIENTDLLSRSNLVDDAPHRRTTFGRGAVEIASAIQDNAARGMAALRLRMVCIEASIEAMDDRARPSTPLCRRQLEYCAAIRTSVAAMSSQVVHGWRWFRSASPAARGLRISVACLLLGLAALDQVRYVRAGRSDDEESLRGAAALNPYDTPVQMRLARKAADKGNTDSAVAAWKVAIAANPADPNPRNALLAYLAKSNRFNEAYTIAQQSLATSPRDGALLVDTGLLAAQLGLSQDAATYWQQALAADPSQTRAHLYLGDHLDRHEIAPLNENCG